MKKIEMTEEVKAKLSGLLPMDKDSVYKFTPDIFKREEIVDTKEFVFKDEKGEAVRDKNKNIKYEIKHTRECVFPEEYRPVIECRQMVNSEKLKFKELFAADAVEYAKKKKGTKEALAKEAARVSACNVEYMKMTADIVCGWSNFIDIGTNEEFEYIKGLDRFMDIPEAVRNSIMKGIMEVFGVMAKTGR